MDVVVSFLEGPPSLTVALADEFGACAVLSEADPRLEAVREAYLAAATGRLTDKQIHAEVAGATLDAVPGAIDEVELAAMVAQGIDRGLARELLTEALTTSRESQMREAKEIGRALARAEACSLVA